jgi:acetyl-CoA synthetase
MIMLKRRYEYWYTTVALHKIGAIIAPVTHMLMVDDIVRRCKSGNIKAAVCITDGESPQKFLEAQKESAVLQTIWTLDGSIPGTRDFTKEVEEAEGLSERIDTSFDEPIIAYFTSGTTDYPKEVIQDHTYPLAHIVTAKYWQKVSDGGLHFTVAETGWGKTSWGKIYGQWIMGCAVMVYDFDTFDPRHLIDVVNRYKVDTFCAPPTIYRYMVKLPSISMPTVRRTCTAGEVLHADVFERFKRITEHSIVESYGQTETVMILGNFDENLIRPGSMGKASPQYHVSLVDEEGNPTLVGEVGEIVIHYNKDGKRPPGLFSEYKDDPELYKKAWRGGFYHTGDLAKQDEDGYYYFEGRKDDVIKTGGYRVGPYEIENVLMRHDAVLECTVLGVPDKLRGQSIKAFVVLVPEVAPGKAIEKELKDFTNRKISDYKWIRALEFVEELPKTISGKIKKRDMKQ